MEKSKRLLRETIAGNSMYVAEALADIHRETTVLLVGVNYDKEKGHSCVIEKYTKQ